LTQPQRSRGACGLPAGPRAARGAKQPAAAPAVATKPCILWLYLTNCNLLGGGKPVRTGPTIVDKTNVDQIAKFASAGTR
jgi:hypothetical protein